MERLQISDKDPFMGAKPKWAMKHAGPFNTIQLMENLQPYDTREHTNQELVKSMCDQESRFYRQDERSEREIEMNSKRKKTLLLEGNIEEAIKLRRLKKELNGSRELIDVDQDWHLFEKETN